MSNQSSFSFLNCFFYDIYKILKESNRNVIKIWYEVSEIKALSGLNNNELSEFLDHFDFIKKKRGNYSDYYIVINKVLFIIDAIKYITLDIKKLSEILDFNGFEALIQEILIKNDYKAVKNFRFSDKSNFKSKTSQKRYEIDVIGIYNSFILIIDAKQWRRKDSFSSMNKAAKLQYQRVIALKKNPDTFSKLIHNLLGLNPNIKRRLPFKLIPIMVTIEDNGIKLNENKVPLVSISNFNSFLQEYPNFLHHYRTIEIKNLSIQTKLF